MRRNTFKITLALIVCTGFYYCSDSNNPLQSYTPDQNLIIKTAQDVYTNSDWITISGTLHNASEDTFYSNLGDGFNSGDDQDNLYIVEGSDGYFQKFDISKDNWINAERGLLTEGTKVVSLLPQKTYMFSFHSRINSQRIKQCRFLIKYYKKDPFSFSTDTLSAISNIFVISGL